MTGSIPNPPPLNGLVWTVAQWDAAWQSKADDAYTPPGTGAVASTLATRLSQEASSIQDFGADPTGVADSTTAIQTALNSGKTALFVPPGTFKFSALVMPTSQYFTLFGVGQASQLIQTGTGITWPSTGTNPCGYYNGSIHHLSFVSSGGTGHTINTQYAGGVTLTDLWFGNMPVGFASIYVNGSPASTGDKYSHDVRMNNIQMYTTTAGSAGIYLDQYTSDLSIDRWVMQGSGVVPQCLYAANGATSFTISNSHPYNAKTNIMLLAGGAVTAQGLHFDNVCFDNVLGGLGDSIVLNNARTARFTGCWFEEIALGKNGVTLTNCSGTNFSNCQWDTNATGAGYIINETGTTDYTEVIGGDSPTLSFFTNPPFNFIGAHSTARNFVATCPWGVLMPYTGSTTATVAAGSTVYLGCNGAQSAIQFTAFMIGMNTGCNVLRADIAWDTAPGAGTYTFTLVGNGSTLGAASGSVNPVTVTGSVFSTSIIIAQGAGAFLVQFNQVVIKMVTSAGAGVPNVRYAIQTLS